MIHAVRDGEWMAADEFRALALEAVESGNDVQLQLEGLDRLDTSALQILLALDGQLRAAGRKLELRQVSARLREWFALAGAEEQFFSPDENPL